MQWHRKSQSAWLNRTAMKNKSIFLKRYTVCASGYVAARASLLFFYTLQRLRNSKMAPMQKAVEKLKRTGKYRDKAKKKVKLNCAPIKNGENNKSTAVCIIIKCPDETKNNRFRWFDIIYTCKMCAWQASRHTRRNPI